MDCLRSCKIIEVTVEFREVRLSELKFRTLSEECRSLACLFWLLAHAREQLLLLD